MIKKFSILILIIGFILAVNISSLFSQEAVGKIIALDGKTEVKSENSQDWRLLNLKDNVYEKDTIKTGEDSQARIFFVDESTVSVGPETTIKIEKLLCSPSKNQREGSLELLAGKARFDVGKLFSKDSTFEVKTPTAVAGVKGTSFIVWVTSEQLTKLMGLSGSVTITSILPSVEGEMLLTSGVMISIEDGMPPGDPVPISFDELIDLLQNLGLINKGDNNIGQGTGGDVGGNTLLGNLGTGGNPPGDGQTGIIDQPLGGHPSNEMLPAPPAPPAD